MAAPIQIPPGDWRRDAYIEWLCTIVDDREPRTLKEFAAQIGTPVAALDRLRADDHFLATWERAYRRTVGSPEKAQTVVHALYETGKDRTDPRMVPAAKAYLEAIDAIKPKKMEVTVKKDAKELTDDDLYKLLAERAEQELRERNDA